MPFTPSMMSGADGSSESTLQLRETESRTRARHHRSSHLAMGLFHTVHLTRQEGVTVRFRQNYVTTPSPIFDEDSVASNLEEQRLAFSHRRFLATPLAGTIAWCVTGACAFATPLVAVWGLFIATGSILYLSLFISRFTGETSLTARSPRTPLILYFFQRF